MAGAKSLVVLCREKMGRAKSLVVLCILLIIAISLAAPCKFSICYRGCRALGVSKAFCAKKCHCGLPSTFASNDQLKMEDYNRAKSVLEEMMMMEDDYNLAAAEMAVDYDLTESVLEEMMMIEEVISFNDKLTAKCKYNPCYPACRALGGSKDYCAKKCRCTQASDMVPSVNPPSRVMAFKLIILAVALVSVIIGIILFPRKKAILFSYFIKIWNFIGIISFRLKKENKRQEDEKDNKKEVNEEKQSLLPASSTAQVAAQAHEEENKIEECVDPQASTAEEEEGTKVIPE